MPLAPPRTLSPTKVTSFTSCPLAFRLRAIDRLPEPSSPAQLEGTLVHTALEHLIWDHPAGQRSLAAGIAALQSAWEALQSDPDFAALGLDDDAAGAFRADAEVLVRNYFELEDPDTVRAVGVEVGVETNLDGRLRLRGIIDRLDLDEGGDLVVVDYKTGKAPGARYEAAKLTGVHLYALLCQRVLGRVPAEVRLLHLRDPLIISSVPTPQLIRGQERRTLAVWQAIERACTRVDFQPRPSGLCRTCNFQPFCPAFGGAPPEVPERHAEVPEALAEVPERLPEVSEALAEVPELPRVLEAPER